MGGISKSGGLVRVDDERFIRQWATQYIAKETAVKAKAARPARNVDLAQIADHDLIFEMLSRGYVVQYMDAEKK